MKFGYFCNTTNWDHKPYQQLLDETKEITTYCDENNWNSIWYTEHHFNHEGMESCTNPLMMGVDAAARTKQIRIGQACNVITFHNPIRLAEDIALLDQLSGGRVEVGIGRGIYGREAINMNKEAIDALIEKNPKLLSPRAKLETMVPSNYCLHRSWGFGKIVDYNAADDRLIIDFEDGKHGHAMAPAFCVDKLDILLPNDLLVRSRTEADAIETMIKKQPADLICEMVSASENQAMMASEIERLLARVIGPIKYKKWWTATKKVLVKDPRIGVPLKKTEPYIYRDEPVKPEDEILEQFHGTKNSMQKIELGEKLYALSENISVVREEMPQILTELTDAIANAKSLSQANRLHGVWVRNNLARDLHEDVETLEPSSASILDATNDYSELAAELPAQYFKRYLDLISRTYPDKWQSMVEDLLRNSSGKFTSECINFMLEHEMQERISYCLDRWLKEQTIKGPLLFWVVNVCNNAGVNESVRLEPSGLF